MERFNSTQLAVALAAGFLATIVGMPSAHAALVYQNTAPAVAPAPVAPVAVAPAPVAVAPAPAVAALPSSPAPVATSALSQQQASRVEDRAALRQAIDSSERAKDTEQAEVAPAVVPVIQSQAAPASSAAVVAPVAGDGTEDVQNMSKAELLRRERVREELRNEDALEERLEELRLRDEQRRTQQILGMTSNAQPGANPVPMPSPLYGNGSLQEQAVVAPVTEHPGQPAAVPSAQPSQAPVQLAGTAAVDQAALGQSTMTASADMDKDRNKTQFSFAPQVGIGGGLGSDGGYYNIDPKFATGFTLGIATSEYVTLELGYTYSQYGVNIASANPFVSEMQAYSGGNLDTLTLNQNVFDAGLKVYLLGRDSMIRPFVSGGGAYAKSYINYNQQILNELGGMSQDYDVSQFLGYVSTGADVKLSKNISVGAMFRYYAVLSSSENGSLNNYAFMGGGYGSGMGSLDKQYVGGTVATSGFYNLLADVSFTF